MPKPQVLYLNLHREHFGKIAAGTKRTEFRERTPYWQRRIEGREFDVVQFRNGYATKAPEVAVEFLGVRRITKWGRPHYGIRLGRVLPLKRGKSSAKPTSSRLDHERSRAHRPPLGGRGPRTAIGLNGHS
jgi:hypothetical protein